MQLKQGASGSWARCTAGSRGCDRGRPRLACARRLCAARGVSRCEGERARRRNSPRRSCYQHRVGAGPGTGYDRRLGIRRPAVHCHAAARRAAPREPRWHYICARTSRRGLVSKNGDGRRCPFYDGLPPPLVGRCTGGDFAREAGDPELPFTFNSLPSVWWTPHPEPEHVMLTGWVGGPRSAGLAGQSADQLAVQACVTLAKVFGVSEDEVRSELVSAHTHDWAGDPFSLGAYSYVPAGALDAPRAMTEPAENTLFLQESIPTSPVIGEPSMQRCAAVCERLRRCWAKNKFSEAAPATCSVAV